MDYAESTGKHNTGTANFVHTLYSEAIPPQADNPLTRTTIFGKPILLFHQADENSDPVFYSKANFNFDKGSLEAFGFTEDYEVESWEFLNNTSDACNFLGEIPSIWVDDFEARYPEDYTDISKFKEMHDWVVSTKDDVDKFVAEFEDHFNMHYALIYYVWTFFALMMDQRAKNMFLTYWGDYVKRWYPYLYDNDSIFGINNEGQRVFDYYLEDTDQLNGMNVYNGQNSVLWNNMRVGFPDKIKETYQSLRNSGKLTYEKVVAAYITNHSDKWSEAIYNEDAYVKYISMLIEDGDASNLAQVRGDAEEDFKYWVSNRFDFCDSKWYAGEYVDNYVSLRIYTPSEWSGIEPNADLTVTYFSTIYAGARYKANGTLYQEKVTAGTPITFEAPDETFNDTETAIYGAHLLSSLGDLAPLYAGSINVAAASKLIELKAGDSTEGYSNPNLKELSVGTNKLMRKVNVCNCPNFTSVLDLSGCPSIEEVYATGSGITGVNFPEAGILRIAQLPATITNLTLKHQLYIEELTLEGYDNVKTLWIENCPTLDASAILANCTNVERLRLTDVNWSYDTAAEMLALAAKNLAGIDENGTNIDYMWIDGTCHIGTLTGAEYLEIKEAFPYMTITYDALTAELVYMSEDGVSEYARETIQNGGDGNYTGATPTKTSTAQYDFAHSGWSLTPGGAADADALKNVEADRIVYAAFTATVRTYTVKFYNGTELKQTVTEVPYGGTATYTGETPTNTSTGNVDDFEFAGWKPSPTNIQGDTNCYAQFYDMREITDDWATIAANVGNGTAESKYAVGAFKTLDIGAKDLPYSFYVGSAVVLNDELHILGSGSSSYYTAHYKWDGASWTSVSTLPYSFRYGSAVVLNDEIHLLGGSDYEKKHYRYDGSTWIEVGTLPSISERHSAVVYNNEIHLLGGETSSTDHYKWDGTTWTSVSTLPYDFYDGSAVVLNDEIHILGGYQSGIIKCHYKYDSTDGWTSVSTLPYSGRQSSVLIYNNELHLIGSESSRKIHYKYISTDGWTSVSTLPYKFYGGSAVVLNDEIHILGSADSSGYKSFYSYSSETQTWSKVGVTDSIPMQIVAHNHDELAAENAWKSIGELPYSFVKGAAVELSGEIHILGSYAQSSYYTAHYKWDGASWTSVSTLPYSFYEGSAVVLNDEIHILGSGSSSYYTAHYKWNSTDGWVSVSTLPYNFYRSMAFVWNDEIHIFGSYDSSYRTAHYKYDATNAAWVSVSTLPYSFYQGGVVLYNDELHLIGGSGGNTTHYKWDATNLAWTQLDTTLPYAFSQGTAMVYDNEIHIMGAYLSSARQKHYKYDGTSWTEDLSLPYSFYDGCGLVYDNKITLLGSYISGNYTRFFQLVGPSWESAGDLPAQFDALQGSCIEYNNVLYMFRRESLYTYDGETWTKLMDLPFSADNPVKSVLNDGAIYFYVASGTTTTEYYKKLYKYDFTEITEAGTLPADSFSVNQTCMVSYNGKIYIIGGQYYPTYGKYYVYDGNTWTMGDLPEALYFVGSVVYNDLIYCLGENGSTYTFDGETFTQIDIGQPKIARASTTSVVALNGCIYARPQVTPHNIVYKWDGASWSTIYTNNGYTIADSIMTSFKGKLHIFGGNYNSYYLNHYSLSNPKATLTFIAGNLLSEAARLNNTNHTYNGATDKTAGGYPVYDLRNYLNGDFLSTLPSDLQSAISAVKKYSDTGYVDRSITTSEEKCWILSHEEFGGTVTDMMIAGQGDAYSVFTDNASRIRNNANLSENRYWTRSTTLLWADGAYYITGSTGVPGAAQSVNVSYGILIGFCI